MSQSLSTLVNQLNAAGHKYGVPPLLLLGVFGMETAFGNDVKTSSTGAVGLMQFEPPTARAYNYPLTNSPTPAQAQQQFDAAAHYLSDLHRQHGGNWDAALRAYSGGGYGLAEVQAKAHSALGTSGAAANFGGLSGVPLVGGVNPLGGVQVPNPLSGVESVAGAVGSIASLLTSAQFWIRLGEAIAGVILIAMGLRSLTGSTTTPVTVVSKAAGALAA